MSGYNNGLDMGYDPEIHQIDRDINEMRQRRQQLLDEAQTPKLPPAEYTMITLAHEAGEMKALYRTERARNDKLEKQLNEIAEEDYDGKIAELKQSRDIWRSRAESLEVTLKRSRAARRNR